MKLYAVRKRRGHWSVYADEDVCLEFDSYDEAVQAAQSAAEVLSSRGAQAAKTESACAPAS